MTVLPTIRGGPGDSGGFSDLLFFSFPPSGLSSSESNSFLLFRSLSRLLLSLRWLLLPLRRLLLLSRLGNLSSPLLLSLDSPRRFLPLLAALGFSSSVLDSLVSFSGSFSSLGGWNSSALMSCLGGAGGAPLGVRFNLPSFLFSSLSSFGSTSSFEGWEGGGPSPVDGVPVAPLVTTGGGPSLWSSSLKSASKVRAAANAKPIESQSCA